MIRIKEGFSGERLLTLPTETLDKYAKDSFIGQLYLRKIGYFPKVKFHYINKNKGCPYAMLIHCIDGKGWCKINNIIHEVNTNQYIFLPPFTSYSFGASEEHPWSIYWLHFEGHLMNEFTPQVPYPQRIILSENSRNTDRSLLFEDLYKSFEMAYTPEYMKFTSICLYQYLATFTLTEPFRYVRQPQQELQFSQRVIHYMKENIDKNFTLEQLAEYFNYSASHFSTLFRQETGHSPIQFYIHIKMQHACRYMELTNLKLQTIAEYLGFEDAAYFSRIFKKVMGMSPSKYRSLEK